MLSLALATHNESDNIVDCIRSCKGLVDEIIVVDGSSTDDTVTRAQQEGANVIVTDNPPMFHINKQKAIDACTGDWILQLDADERVTPELAEEIKKIIGMTESEIAEHQSRLIEKRLFERHQMLVESQKSKVESNTTKSNKLRDAQYNAFFIPRLNYFLGGYLRYGGVYPDGVIRLIRKGKARLPCKDVHELMEVEGRTGWVANALIHKDSPTFARYLARNSRYIDHLVAEISRNAKRETQNVSNATRYTLHVTLFVKYVVVMPMVTFLSMLIRHKGILDGWRGVVFAFFSAIRFARAYVRYIMHLS